MSTFTVWGWGRRKFQIPDGHGSEALNTGPLLEAATCWLLRSTSESLYSLPPWDPSASTAMPNALFTSRESLWVFCGCRLKEPSAPTACKKGGYSGYRSTGICLPQEDTVFGTLMTGLEGFLRQRLLGPDFRVSGSTHLAGAWAPVLLVRSQVMTTFIEDVWKGLAFLPAPWQNTSIFWRCWHPSTSPLIFTSTVSSTKTYFKIGFLGKKKFLMMLNYQMWISKHTDE